MAARGVRTVGRLPVASPFTGLDFKRCKDVLGARLHCGDDLAEGQRAEGGGSRATHAYRRPGKVTAGSGATDAR